MNRDYGDNHPSNDKFWGFHTVPWDIPFGIAKKIKQTKVRFGDDADLRFAVAAWNIKESA
jgi:hypothetical protein